MNRDHQLASDHIAMAIDQLTEARSLIDHQCATYVVLGLMIHEGCEAQKALRHCPTGASDEP